MQVTSHEPGTFCWAELETTDSAGAKSFYNAILGWNYTDNPMGPDMVYTMCDVGGSVVGALYQDNSGKKPPCWNTYISVTSADEAAATIKENGGTLIVEPFDVMTVGRMAVVQDPTGGVFAIWEPKDHFGYALEYDPGAVCWNELMTRDTAAAEKFYSTVFGYGIKQSMMPMPYTEFQLDGKSIAGMLAMKPDMENVPPHWLIYFSVANCGTAVDTAKSLGGEVLFGPFAVPEVGNIAVIKDPQGAVFGIAGG